MGNSGFDIISSLITDKRIEKGVLFTELRRGSYNLDPSRPFPPVSQLIMNIIVTKGTMKIVIDNIKHNCTDKELNLVSIKPLNEITDLRLSDNFRGYVIVISKQFMDVAQKEKTIPFRDVVSTRSLHAITLDKSDIEILSDYFHIMEKNSDLGGSSLNESIFQYAVLLCHSKIVQQVFLSKNKVLCKAGVTRASMLCNQFFELIIQHIEKEHTVKFYANKLNITTHYLSKITNDLLDSPANKIIANELILHAFSLLRNPNYTLQQIADRLHFHDQSSFGKFFKKHTGKTPTIYRKDSNLALNDDKRFSDFSLRDSEIQ